MKTKVSQFTILLKVNAENKEFNVLKAYDPNGKLLYTELYARPLKSAGSFAPFNPQSSKRNSILFDRISKNAQKTVDKLIQKKKSLFSFLKRK